MIPKPHRVLMIAAAFPPAGGSGVQRTLKFTKYLGQFGWHPIVWTVDHIDALPTDASLCLDIPSNVEVHRQPHPFGSNPAGRLTNMLRQTGAFGSRLANAAEWRIEKWNRKRCWPDEFSKWVKRSIAPLQRIIRDQNVRAIYSTYSPAANHALAIQIKQATGLPWVADFRDLWTDDLRYHEPDERRHIANIELEQSILEQADAVVGVSPPQTKVLAGHVPNQATKFSTITNGFDPADFAEMAEGSKNPNHPFTLAFVGRFDRHRADDDLFVALRRFVAGLGERRDRFVFRIVGEFDSSTDRKLQDAGIPYASTGYVSHQAAVNEMRTADALLLTTDRGGPNAKTVICGKIFEYLASERPILAVGPTGWEGERLVRENQAGITVTWNPQDIAHALNKLFNAWKTGVPIGGAKANQIKNFSRVSLTQRLASLLNQVTASCPNANTNQNQKTLEPITP